MKKKISVREMVLIAVLASISMVLMILKFPLPFMPPFMSFDFAAISELIGGFVLGPVGAIFIITIKILLKVVIQGSSSMFTGEIQNFILSCAFVLPASIIYQKNRTKKNAIIGMSIGVILLVVISIISNLYFIIPFYAKLFNYSMQDIIMMSKSVNPLIDSPLKLVLLGIIPFNIIKGSLITLITTLMYKRISVILVNNTKKKVIKNEV